MTDSGYLVLRDVLPEFRNTKGVCNEQYCLD
eukprot:CAMPEP_0174350066 /NCGR_PEP_ID=MMETSP0811_2-20130205/7040_1 /TAXON_ID=73025 ORGANISM="Eutreptiella gymnastica-like, Strain CCMP1594" /NCGR_SAMPLE_ID=MMETSP0811_2 /ASSEMBLY_ACC=CAM_ASM_000667 /LENGTH=30 /DNA_ID= /DNA_START= /DNA_END= /DNA_ORIENTATION=